MQKNNRRVKTSAICIQNAFFTKMPPDDKRKMFSSYTNSFGDGAENPLIDEGGQRNCQGMKNRRKTTYDPQWKQP
ncbi:MAG: hypothetical protein G5701_02040 [Serratia symbiotica]|nr:hypothetical protein [Serratia symbiotica]